MSLKSLSGFGNANYHAKSKADGDLHVVGKKAKRKNFGPTKTPFNYKVRAGRWVDDNLNLTANEDGEDEYDLTNDGVVCFVDMSITPRYHPEIGDGDEIIVEDTCEILDNEGCTRWA